MSAILLEGQIVHYEVLGRGRPIIFLHGWVGSWRYWISSMQVASTSFRAYGLDLWGFGESAHDTMRYTIDQQTDLLSRFLDEMGIGKVALVGHGLGALVGFNFCSRWTQSVDRMMAVNSPLYYDSINARLRTSSLPDLVNWLGSKAPEAATALADASKADLKRLPIRSAVSNRTVCSTKCVIHKSRVCSCMDRMILLSRRLLRIIPSACRI